VNGAEKGEIVRIDAATNKVDAHWPLPGCTKPHGLAIDRVTHCLFSSCANKVLVVVDAEKGSVIATLPIGEEPTGRNSIPNATWPSAQTARERFHHRGEIIRELRAAIPGPTQFGARTMALDPESGRIFLVAADFTLNPKAAASDPRIATRSRRDRAAPVPGPRPTLNIGEAGLGHLLGGRCCADRPSAVS